MTNVLVCIKRVPDSSSEVVLSADGQAVDARNVGYTVSVHEECAIALAAQIAGDSGGTSTVLTLGSDEAIEQLRTALAVGIDDAVLMEADSSAFGPADVAAAIAAVVRAREGAGTAYDLVLLGNDAADTGDFQVGVRLAYALDRPVVAGVTTISLDGGLASMVADSADGTAVHDVELPAVATVLEGGITPRYPSLVGRMKAKKASIDTVVPDVHPAGTGRLRLRLPPPVPNEVRILGEGPSAAPAVVAVLKELGVVR